MKDLPPELPKPVSRIEVDGVVETVFGSDAPSMKDYLKAHKPKRKRDERGRFV
jgi:hypothetical protein